MKGMIPPGLFDDETFDRENMISAGKQTKNIFHLWLLEEISEPKQYLKWYDILQNAGEDDLIVIHINCFGGDVWTANQIITQIKTCQAQVVCQIESACCSAATMIALACDGLLCYPHSYMMIHTSSGFAFGKQSDIKREEAFYNRWLEKFFDEIYRDFLTKKEIQDVLDGKDMWLDADEVMSRFRHRVEVINRANAKMKKQEREHIKKLHSFMSSLQNNESLDDLVDETEKEDAKSEGKSEKKDRPGKKSPKTKKTAK